jgi:hypothetical protein
MAKLRSRKDVDLLYKRAEQMASGSKILNFSTQVAMRTRLGGLRGGYINRLNRLQKKGVPQLRGIPGCGPTVRDWLLDLDR